MTERKLTTEISWRQLRVFDTDGNDCGNLEQFLRENRHWANNIVLAADGSMAEWQDWFIAAPGEESDWDTPRCAVDWSGFSAEITERRNSHPEEREK